MANWIHTVFGRKMSAENDTEQGKSQPSSNPPGAPVDLHGRPEIPADDQLNLFRHLTGIISHPSMSHDDSIFSFGGQTARPAPNLGIYARVVHNEQTAKRGYKHFSWLINGCLGLQIIVAAALTAMGAAGAGRSAVTVFGAINTVIAGVLTFLKGSGLPNRLKYYQAEWKRVREFIEQRERDFSRPECDLDVYGVVAMVETMYEDVKMDLEASMPDRFAGFGNARKGFGPAEPNTANTKVTTLPLPRIEGLTEKFKELESGFGGKVKDLASEIGHRAYSAKDAARDLEEHRTTVYEEADKEFKGYAKRVKQQEANFSNRVKDLESEIGHRAIDVARNLEAHRTGLVEEASKDIEHLAERAGHAGRAAIQSAVSVPMTIPLGGTE